MHRGPLPTTIAVLSLLWLGLLLGVSFLATPVKFLAPSLSLPVALDVGRQTFMVLNRVELVLAVVLLGLIVTTRRPGLLGAAGALAVLVAAQWLWLLPVLDSRVEIILQGGTPPPSMLHRLYILVEVCKLLLLAAVPLLVTRAAAAGTPPR